MANLIGIYQITKSNLVSNSTHLVIAQRKKIEGTKPKQYLLLKSGETSFKYISSLYPSTIGENFYEIDYSKEKYVLAMSVDAGKALIISADKLTNGPSITMSISALQAHFFNNQNISN